MSNEYTIKVSSSICYGETVLQSLYHFNRHGKNPDNFVGLYLLNKTRPDTRQSSRGRLGRNSNAKTARDARDARSGGRTDRPTRQGVESRVRD